MAIRAIGDVKRIYSDKGGAYIRLGGIPASATPRHGYFRLPLTHPNYNALYSLAIVAATNGYKLHIRTEATIVSTEIATVNYMVVDW